MIFDPLFPLLPYAIVVGILAVAFIVYAVRQVRTSDLGRGAWLRRGAIFALIALIGFGPAVLEETSESVRINLDVYLVVDRTGSMAAEDYHDEQPRLEGVRADIATLTEELGGARFSVVSFDSTASRQLPLTTDVGALRDWAHTMNQEITIYSSGSNLNRVLGDLTILLERGRENNPLNKQLVFIMSDGENTSDEPRTDFKHLAPLIDGGAVLGYGTAEGARMKRYDPLLDDDSYILDHSGSSPTVAISKIDEAELEALASELGIEYLHRTEPGALSSVTAGLESELVATQGSRAIMIPQLIVWPFAVLTCLLMLWELTAATSRMSRVVG
jgi:Ca-activated chloride channel family protein